MARFHNGSRTIQRQLSRHHRRRKMVNNGCRCLFITLRPTVALPKKLLSFPALDCRTDLFLQQCRQDQQWTNREPGQGCRFVRHPAQLVDQCRILDRSEQGRQQLLLQAFKLLFHHTPARSGPRLVRFPRRFIPILFPCTHTFSWLSNSDVRQKLHPNYSRCGSLFTLQRCNRVVGQCEQEKLSDVGRKLLARGFSCHTRRFAGDAPTAGIRDSVASTLNSTAARNVPLLAKVTNSPSPRQRASTPDRGSTPVLAACVSNTTVR